MQYVVYILYSEKFNKSYVGFTTDLVDRFKSHNELGSGWTKPFRPWLVIHVEFFDDKLTAMKREKYFKSGSGLYFFKP
jgi:putative endonuclease